ncbi:hypothetical protein F5884DRAFT_753906 [Xylogone sp. PMI_703]|nr:hypothetical protein F5884DRAFT_753906 [Xylogone sp. PMI_703]
MTLFFIFILGRALGALMAVAADAHGWLGDVIIHKHTIAIFSAAIVVVGYSMRSINTEQLPLVTAPMAEGFGLGAVLCTIPAYISSPNGSLRNGMLHISLNTVLGGVTAYYNPSLILGRFYLGLVAVLTMLPRIFDATATMVKSLLAHSENGLPSEEVLEKDDITISATDGNDLYDYYYQTGDKLRPPPARTLESPEWFQMRKNLFSRYMTVLPTPKSTPLIRKLQDHFWQGDEYMDPVIALGRRTSMGKVRNMVHQALTHGIESVPDVPEEIVRLFEHLDRKPSWFDEDEYERGRVILLGSTMVGRLTTFAMNIVMTALSQAVANAVGSTGQYTNTKTVIRRHLETAHFFHRISLPRGSDRFSETFQEIVKVRFMHSQVRYAAKKRWGSKVFAFHGNAISNTDMALGITSFGILNLIFDNIFGRDFTISDLDAAVKHWGYIGYVFGVAEDIIPKSFKEGVEEFDYILSTHGYAPEWSPKVSDSQLIVLEEATRLISNPSMQCFVSVTAVPLFHGLLYSFGGDELGYRAVIAMTVAKALVILSTIFKALPGNDARMEVSSKRGNGVGFLVLEKIAKRVGLSSVTFETHDKSDPMDFAIISI